MDFEELEAIADRKLREREKTIKETERINRLLKMPFNERIQQEGEEEVLKRVEKNQKDVFFNYSAKKWNIKKDEVLELFQEYFTEFLNGKVKNIATFLTERGYSFPGEREGKIILGK